jgi:acetolactate synthase-1/2/3 large subunit
MEGERMKLKGAEIVWECLVREGVDVVFGYPGGANMPIYDAMLNYPVHHVLVRHEQGASHMADGYARVSGKVGVAMATSGPGATNLVTGICTSMMDSVPVVFITGQVAAHLIGGDAFQETDVTGITLPITKHNYLVTRADEIAETIREAFYIARSGRPGPVLIDICKNAQVELCDFEYPDEPTLAGYKPVTRSPRNLLEKLLLAPEHVRMNQRVQRFQPRDIRKDDSSEYLAIHLAVGRENMRAERADHVIVRLTAAPQDLMPQPVGLDDMAAEIL